MQKHVSLYVAGVSLCGLCAYGTLTSEQARQETADCIRSGRQAEQSERLRSNISETLENSFSLNDSDLFTLAAASDCIRFMRLTAETPLDPETAAWILASEQRLHLFVETVLPTDRLKRCFEILGILSRYDAAERDDWFELMLAISVVWDVGKRPSVHRQMGEHVLPYKSLVCPRYKYFKDLYSSGNAKMLYSRLGVGELIFVVETPVSLSELQWAQEHESGTLQDWGRKFFDIEYDHDRLIAAEHDWPWGEYKLSEIKERGGICVDQAYYAVMTARAFGIPAIYFRAMGIGGGHAWFSYMVQPGNWILDVGRYESEEYTTGEAISPQTNEKLTDHDVAYTCERSLHSEEFRQANAYSSIAEVMLASNPKQARRCAQEARRLAPRYLRPWKLESEALVAEEQYNELLELLKEQQMVFDEYPDLLVAALNHVEPNLREAGRDDDADWLRRSLSREVDSARDDLMRLLGQDEIDQLVKSGDLKKARRRMEELLEEHIADGGKVLKLLDRFVEMTKDSKEARSAARFLEKYSRDFEQENGSRFKYSLLRRLRDVYKNAGDERSAAEIQLQLDCL